MKPTIVNLDQTFSNFDNENIEKWREQSRANEEKITETLKAAGFTPECIGYAIGFYNAKRFCVAEQETMGVQQFIAVVWDGNDAINVDMYFKTPEAFYGSQGLGSVYQSGRDPRFEAIRKDLERVWDECKKSTEDPKQAFNNAMAYINDKINSLTHEVWEEKIGLLYKAVGCNEIPVVW